MENEATFFKPNMKWRVASTSTVNPDERELIVDSGASMHWMSKMGLTPEELETVKVSRLPTSVITANGSIDTTEEGDRPSERFGHFRHSSSKTHQRCYLWENPANKTCIFMN